MSAHAGAIRFGGVDVVEGFKVGVGGEFRGVEGALDVVFSGLFTQSGDGAVGNGSAAVGFDNFNATREQGVDCGLGRVPTFATDCSPDFKLEFVEIGSSSVKKGALAQIMVKKFAKEIGNALGFDNAIDNLLEKDVALLAGLFFGAGHVGESRFVEPHQGGLEVLAGAGHQLHHVMASDAANRFGHHKNAGNRFVDGDASAAGGAVNEGANAAKMLAQVGGVVLGGGFCAGFKKAFILRPVLGVAVDEHDGPRFNSVFNLFKAKILGGDLGHVEGLGVAGARDNNSRVTGAKVLDLASGLVDELQATVVGAVFEAEDG